jgi:REP element-mobilizing transposase RayT
VSLPRPILPGSIYLLTRRCTQRQFLLKPTPLTCQIFQYCLAVAAERTGVLVHAACVLSNHWHAVVSDPHGHMPVFTAELHKYVSKAVNASLGRWENLWASEQPSQVRLVGPEDVIARMIYTLANPVAARLVARAEQWPGVWGYLPAHSKAVARPRVFFRDNGPMPAVATLSFVAPELPGFPADEVYGAVAAGIAAREAEVAQAPLLGTQRDTCSLAAATHRPGHPQAQTQHAHGAMERSDPVHLDPYSVLDRGQELIGHYQGQRAARRYLEMIIGNPAATSDNLLRVTPVRLYLLAHAGSDLALRLAPDEEGHGPHNSIDRQEQRYGVCADLGQVDGAWYGRCARRKPGKLGIAGGCAIGGSAA